MALAFWLSVVVPMLALLLYIVTLASYSSPESRANFREFIFYAVGLIRGLASSGRRLTPDAVLFRSRLGWLPRRYLGATLASGAGVTQGVAPPGCAWFMPLLRM